MPELSAEEEPAFDALVDELFAERAAAARELFALFERNHPHEQRHYYLSLWGTHRDHAGAGLGAALISECLGLIDAERMPCYLESTNPANVARYEALGFGMLGEFARAGGPPLSTMWREAS